MSKKVNGVLEVVEEKVGTVIEEVTEKKYFGKFTKKDLAKIGLGVGATVGAVFLIKKLRSVDYDVLNEVIEDVGEIVGE